MSSETERTQPSVDRGVHEVEIPVEEVAAEERGFRALFESAPDAIFVEDLSGKVLDVNPAGCRLHRMRREELVGLGVTDLVPPDRRAEARKNFEKLLNGPMDRSEGFSYTSDGEAIPVGLRVSRFRYCGKPALLLHINDISEQRMLEEQLRQSQKMEAIGRLAGGVAHDFNNLLTALLGYTELGMKALGPDHKVYGDLVEVKKAGEQAANLTRQLLAFSRQQVLEPRVLDLNEIVLNIEKLCRRTIGEDIKLVTRLGGDLKRVKVDKGQLEQVILNLAVNSRDAMPAGGEIRIRTKNVTLDEEYVARHRPVRPGSYVSLTVADTGCGMTDEVRRQAFDPFFTTKEPDKGTGLGLSTVYGIVKQSGGYIWVDSKPGEGTSFQILLPPTEAEAEPEETSTLPSIQPVNTSEKTILLTEDDQVVRELSSQVLEELGYRVLAAECAEEALRISHQYGEAIDLLLSDLVLPGMDGLTMTREILADRPETRALLMTGHSKEARFNPDALLDGASFLQNPFTPADLERAVAGALARPCSSRSRLAVGR